MNIPTKKNTAWTPQMLATSALVIAISFLLSYIKLFSMPAGGSITLVSMLPVMLFSIFYGTVPGLCCGLAYGLLQFIQKPEVYHWLQVVLDYPVAFAMLGLAGLFRKQNPKWGLPLGVLVGCFGRFVCHFITGMVFFAEYAPASDFWSVFLYSAGYNGSIMGVEAIITMVIISLPPVQHMVQRVERIVKQ